MSVSVIIPTLNEEASIDSVLANIPRDVVDEVIVVDGGSTDNTQQIAKTRGATVIEETRSGYGRACALGAETASSEYIVFMDADGANDPNQISDLIGPVQDGHADMVLGSRILGVIQPGAMQWHQRFGNQFSAWLFRLFYSLNITDLGPFRAVNRSKLMALDLGDMTYGWPTEMIAKGARSGWNIIEIPVTCRPRIGGDSKISGTLKGTIGATYAILITILRNLRY